MARQKRQDRRRSDSEDDNDSHESRSRSRERQRIGFYEEQQKYGSDEDQQENGESSSNRGSRGQEKNNPQRIAVEIRSVFLDFFGNIRHEKGFVFTQQQRKKLNKEQIRVQKKDHSHKILVWKDLCEWQMDAQKIRIQTCFQRENLDLSKQMLQKLKDVFLKTSYLFGSESTGEVYMLLMGILKICLRFPEQNQNLKRQLKAFIDSMRKDVVNFKIFNFKFSQYYKLPPDNSVNVEEVYYSLGCQIEKFLRMAVYESD